MVTRDQNRGAVLAPGGSRRPGYSPLLMYAEQAVSRRGGRVHPIGWQPDRPWTESHAWVTERVTAALAEAAAAGITEPVLIGKSLGSLAAPLAADRGLAAVWFTPLLTDPATVAALHRATAPCLLAGGSADRLWDGAAARAITPHVVEIERADHNLLLPGGLAASAAVLGQVVTAVEQFLDQIVWP
jgi:hypothetical protein